MSGGQHPEEVKKIGSETVVMPRLLLYPERIMEQRSGVVRKEEVTKYRGEIGDQGRFPELQEQNGVPSRLGHGQVN